MSSLHFNTDKPLAFIKRAMFLAWKESSVFGAGILRDKGNQPEDIVFEAVSSRSDYNGAFQRENEFNADYVFGRMMKLRLRKHMHSVEFVGSDYFNPEYQSFAHKYPTITDLFEATRLSLEEPINNSTTQPAVNQK